MLFRSVCKSAIAIWSTGRACSSPPITAVRAEPNIHINMHADRDFAPSTCWRYQPKNPINYPFYKCRTCFYSVRHCRFTDLPRSTRGIGYCRVYPYFVTEGVQGDIAVIGIFGVEDGLPVRKADLASLSVGHRNAAYKHRWQGNAGEGQRKHAEKGLPSPSFHTVTIADP